MARFYIPENDSVFNKLTILTNQYKKMINRTIESGIDNVNENIIIQDRIEKACCEINDILNSIK